MGSRTIESKEIGKFNIDNDLVYVVNQGDFGYTSDDDTISVATTQDVGGIKLYTSEEAKSGVIDDKALTYAVQIQSEANPKAFVHVPWINSQYMVRNDTGTEVSELSLYVDSDNITTVGDIQMSSLGWLNIHHLDVSKIWNGGDMLCAMSANVFSAYIFDSGLSAAISSDISSINNDIQELTKKHDTDILNMSSDISVVSTILSIELNELCSNLSTDIDNISALIVTNTYLSIYTKDLNPAYFEDETSSKYEIDNMFNSLSNTICANYMYKYESYLCAETSSKAELDSMFATKQNNLSVRTSVIKDYSSILDIPTVKAVQDFVNSSMLTNTATFRGSYDSLKDVPTDGTKYVGGKPDLNDYMFVDITDDTSGAWRSSLTTLAKGTWRFKYVPKTWDEGGIGGWYEEYLINDAMFTDALKKALNSGITDYLVGLIMSYSSIKAKLTAECPNMTASLGSLAYLNEITNNITGKGNAGKLAVFDGTNSIKSSDSITPKAETWQFTLVDGTKITKKVVVSE